MQALLGVFAAGDVDLVAMHAAPLDVEVPELWIEATGPFHVAATSACTAIEDPADEAGEAYRRARELTEDGAERRFLERRLTGLARQALAMTRRQQAECLSTDTDDDRRLSWKEWTPSTNSGYSRLCEAID